MVLLDKKSLKLEGVQDFAWSPSQPILCAYQTEQAGGNLPARISLISFPEKRELRQKNLFSVSGARLRRSRPLSVRLCMDCVLKVDPGHALHVVKNGPQSCSACRDALPSLWSAYGIGQIGRDSEVFPLCSQMCACSGTLRVTTWPCKWTASQRLGSRPSRPLSSSPSRSAIFPWRCAPLSHA